MKILTFLTVIALLVIMHRPVVSKVVLQESDYDYDDRYSNIMRERYRTYCLKNLEKTFKSWKLLFKSVESYCEFAVQQAGTHGAFVRRGPPGIISDCTSLENCDDNLPAI